MTDSIKSKDLENDSNRSISERFFPSFMRSSLMGAMPITMIPHFGASPGGVSKVCIVLAGLCAAPLLSIAADVYRRNHAPYDIAYGPLVGLPEIAGFGAWGLAGVFAMNAADTSVGAALGVAALCTVFGPGLVAFDDTLSQRKKSLGYLGGVLGVLLSASGMFAVSETHYAHQVKLAPSSSLPHIAAEVHKKGGTVKGVPPKTEVGMEDRRSTESSKELALQKKEIYLKKLRIVQGRQQTIENSSKAQFPHCEAIQKKSADGGAHIDVYYYEMQGQQWDISLMIGSSQQLDRAWVRSTSHENQEHIDFITSENPQFYRSSGVHEKVPSALHDKLVKLNTAPDQICASVSLRNF